MCITSLLGYEPIAGSVDMRPYQRGNEVNGVQKWQNNYLKNLNKAMLSKGNKINKSAIPNSLKFFTFSPAQPELRIYLPEPDLSICTGTFRNLT